MLAAAVAGTFHRMGNRHCRVLVFDVVHREGCLGLPGERYRPRVNVNIRVVPVTDKMFLDWCQPIREGVTVGRTDDRVLVRLISRLCHSACPCLHERVDLFVAALSWAFRAYR